MTKFEQGVRSEGMLPYSARKRLMYLLAAGAKQISLYRIFHGGFKHYILRAYISSTKSYIYILKTLTYPYWCPPKSIIRIS